MNLKERATKKLTFSFGHINTEGKTKIETSDIIEKEMTIIDFDFAQINNDTFAVVIFKELPEAFYFGGLVMTDLLADIAEDKQAMAELTKDGLKIKMHMEQSRSDKLRSYAKLELV